MVAGNVVRLTLMDATMTQLVPITNGDLKAGVASWTEFAAGTAVEPQMFCTINGVYHSCAVDTGSNKVEITLLADVAQGTHLYSIGHVGVDEVQDTKTGFHLASGTKALEFRFKFEIIQGISTPLTIHTEKYRIARSTETLTDFKLLDWATLKPETMTQLTF
jgi:hypothetical protein